MGGETIVRKAQVQAAVVRDEIRDGYDRILEGKIIWEKISLPGILYGMEVSDVEDRVLEELEAIQVWLGRVLLGVSDRVGGECVLWELGWLPMKLWIAARRIGFYWRMRSIDDNRCSKKIFNDRQGVGWAAKVRRIMEQNGLDRDGSGAENQVVLETLRGVAMREWARDMSRRVENRGDGQLSWQRVYRWRDSWGQGGVARAMGYERLWVKVRLGDWECNLREWRMGKWVHRCWGCGARYADLAHYMLKCREFRQGRDRVAGTLREIWGNERWEQWAGMSEELQVAEWLGLRGGCSDRQKGAIVEFLVEIDRKGSRGLEMQLSGQRVMGRNEEGEE